MYKTCLIVVLCFLASCATNKSVPDGYIGPTSSILDTYVSISKGRANYFEATAVNGRPVKSSSTSASEASFGRGFTLINAMSEREVPSQKSEISIRGITYSAAPILDLFGKNYSVYGNVQISLKPDQYYVVNGIISESFSGVWIEEESGLIVSEIIYTGTVSKAYVDEFRENKIDQYHQKIARNKKTEEKRSGLIDLGVASYKDGECNIDNDNIPMTFHVAKALFESRHYEEALACFKSSLSNQPVDPEAYKYIYLIYDVGLGVEPDANEARKWESLYK